MELLESQNTPSSELPEATDLIAFEYVSFWPRVAARLIDMALHYVVAFSVAIALVFGAALMEGLASIPSAPFLQSLQKTTAFSFVFAVLGSIGYHAAAEAIHGRSLGKRLLGIVVLSEEGRPCTPTQALKRSLAFVVDSLFFGMVGAHFMEESSRERRLGDRWAGTIVVRSRSLPAQRRGSNAECFAAVVVGIAIDFLLIASSYILGHALS